MKKLLLTSALALGLTTGLFADNIQIFSTNGGAAAGTTFINFDDLALGSANQSTGGVSITFAGGAAVVVGAAPNQYAAPFLSGNNGNGFGSPDQADGVDMTNYLSTGIGSISLAFGSDQKYFGLLWGSVDDYNTLTFMNNGASVGVFTGLDVTAFADGDQGASGTYYVTFNNLDGVFDEVVMTSSQFAFEFDNVSFGETSQVPDSGATVALLGLGLIGLAALRRKL